MSDTATGPRPAPGKEWVLVPHPDFPSVAIRSVTVEIRRTATDFLLIYNVEAGETLLIPGRQISERADGLWKTTCFELFLQRASSPVYFEFNFSPSSRWAAYRFDQYRAGMRDMPLAVDPCIAAVERQKAYSLEIDLKLGITIPNDELDMGLSAVIEEIDGTKSYWALAHAPGPPDFHNRDCFIATLPAPARP